MNASVHKSRTNSATAAAEQLAQQAATAATSQGTCFSRSTGLPVTMGKSTEELKTKVPDAVKAAFTSLAVASGTNHYLGTHDTAEQAHAAYLAAKRKLREGCTL